MYVNKLRLRNYRNFTDSTIELTDSLNAFEGGNGAGKTSILEAIDILVRGKSFRTSSISNAIQHDQTEMMLDSELVDSTGLKRSLSIRKSEDYRQTFFDQQKLNRQSTVSLQIPMVVIHPNVSELIGEGPAIRRSYLDWGLFHVEPSFVGLYRKYHKIIQQRNAAIKLRNRQLVRGTTVLLGEEGTRIGEMRSRYLLELKGYIDQVFRSLQLDTAIILEYVDGWTDGKTLIECLHEEDQLNRSVNSCSYGPHRADLMIRWGKGYLANEASRGQQKILAIALKFVQTLDLITRTGKKPIILVDELPAELDETRVKLVFQFIERLGAQVLVTCVSRNQLLSNIQSAVSWFHVEHGEVTRVV